MKKLYRDEHWLREQYWEKGNYIYQIAGLCSCASNTIVYWMNKFSIRRRNRREQNLERYSHSKFRNRDWLYEKYWEQKSSACKIAKQIGVSKRTVLLWLAEFDIPKRTSVESKRFQYEGGSWLREQYLQLERSAFEIANECGVNRQTIINQMIYYGIPIRKKDQATRVRFKHKERWDYEGWRQNVSRAKQKSWADGIYDGVFDSPTSIELEVAQVLDLLDIEHEIQFRPEGCSYIWDEFIPPNILLELHGDYWHGNPLCYEEKDLNAIQLRGQCRDKKKVQWARDNGYDSIVLWEHEIKELGAWPALRNKMPSLIEALL